MNKRVLVSLVSALFFAPTLLSAQTQVVEASASSLRLQTLAGAPVLGRVEVDGLVFTTVSVEGFGQSASMGLPSLPCKVEMVEVPQGARPEIVVDRVESYTVDLAAEGFPHFVLPAQGPRSKNPAAKRAFVFDTAAYASYRAAESPVSLVEAGTLHNLRLASVRISPVAYDPAAHTLTVYTRIDFHIDFKGADWAATRQFKERYASVAYRGVESGLLYSLRAQLPRTKSAVYTQAPVYVIVSDPMFYDSLQKFVAWKTLLGFRVKVAYTDEVEVGKTRTSIRAYLKKLYDEATPEEPAPTYVLLVGDVAQVPNGNTYSDPYYGDKHVSDLYLCEYTGDRLPDVLYGRMSASNVEELMPQIDKLMYMENIPYEKTAFLDSSFLIAGVDNQGYSTAYLNPTINYLHSLYFKDSASRHCAMYPYPNSASASRNIIADINAGVSVGIYTAHGDWDRWENPTVTNSNVAQFTNKDKYPFLVGNCCLTGKMTKPSCFGESLLRKKDAGAVAYIGASNSSYFDEDVYWAVGYTENLNLGEVYTYTYENTGFGANDAFFHTHGEPYDKWALSVAEIMQTGNMAVEGSPTEDTMKAYYWQIYHVFGDPSYIPYNHRPAPITAIYDKGFKPGTASFVVTTWPYARVALSRRGRNVAFAMADAGGRARLDVSGVSEECVLSLCISAQNGLPLIDEVKVSLSDVSNEEGGAGVRAPFLRMQVVRARGGELLVGLQSEVGEVSGVLRLVNAAGGVVAVLDPHLRVDAQLQTHSYGVGDLPSGLYLCTLTTPDGRMATCKFVVR